MMTGMIRRLGKLYQAERSRSSSRMAAYSRRV